MRYLPLTAQDREEIRQTLGISRTAELFSCIAEGQCHFPLTTLPAALSEPELLEKFKEYAAKNSYHDHLSFLGGGAYRHFIPEVVNFLSSKGEFVTPYTPYQPEVSQGSLQAMFEYQTLMTQLSGLDVSNSSLYDGGTAAAEAMLLILRKSGRKKVLVAGNLHPEYIEIMRTFVQNIDCRLELLDFCRREGKIVLDDLHRKLDDDTAGVIFGSPNFFGVVEESEQIAAAVHAKKAYAVQVISEAMSLAFLTPPGEQGVDLAVGEAQSFGIPLGFGGPYLGFMTAREEFLRQMPGRIVGQTVDVDGKRGYVLTLSTREQHIKREKATSNICSNEAWCAFRAAMYLVTMGKAGLMQVARQNHENTVYFVQQLAAVPGISVRFTRDFFNEVVVDIPGDVQLCLDRLKKNGILAGIPLKWFFPDLSGSILINFTEMHKKEDIDRLVKALGDVR